MGSHLAALLESAGHEVVILDLGDERKAGAGAARLEEAASGTDESAQSISEAGGGRVESPGSETSGTTPSGTETFGPGTSGPGGSAEGGAPLRATFHECDITDYDRLAALLRSIKPDAVAHLAAFSSAGLSFKDPSKAFEVNARGTVNVLEAVKDTGTKPRVLTISSAEVYSAPEGKEPLSESSPIGPVNPYGLGKACGELVAFHYYSVWDVDLTVVRPFNHTGPGQSDVFVLPSFAKQVAEAEKGLRDPVLSVGNLDVVRDFTDVRDIVEAYRLLLERRPPGSIYNVCSGRSYVIRELVDRLISLSTVKMEIKTDPKRRRKAETPALMGDNGLIARDLNWRPKISMNKTLEDLLAYWRAVV